MNETKTTNWGLNTKDLNHWLENDLKTKDTLKEQLQALIASQQIPEALKSVLTMPPSPPASLVELAPIQCKRKADSEPLEVVLKRQRNTDSARRSRQRKAQRIETLESRVQELKSENNALSVKVAVLESKVEHITEREQTNRSRVQELEAQLAAVHRQLLSNV
ncbi:hypothetical protein BY458DRAFT_518467 [Sporodiniella umbellata]|nr:hypothetical protein BY458DRAFT_518467 [Sporodiniella umbellata]